MATNNKGNSFISLAGGGGLIYHVPEPPIELTEILSDRTNTTLGFSWLPGLDNGAYSLIDYTVFVYDGDYTYDVTAPTLDAATTSTYTAIGLSLGTIYNF
jgi:hypothetical protein